MNINYEYFLNYTKKQENYQNIKVLDFGCGKGDILKLLLDNGIDCTGVDVYHQGISDNVLNNGLYQNGNIKVTKKGDKLPFSNEKFDLIISNQVFEHVSDLKFYFDELERILKSSGKMYFHFPSKEVWREGHIGILFSHWFSPNSKIRFYYLYIARLFGFGRNKKGKTIKEWVRHSLNYLDTYCFYAKYSDIKKMLPGFKISHKEIDYIEYRADKFLLLKIFFKVSFLNKVHELIFKKLAFMCIELRKK